MKKDSHRVNDESPLDKADYNTSQAAIYPDFLKTKKRWLLFRLGQPDARGKQPKYPYYSSGTMRKGQQGSEDDLNRLCSFDEALAGVKSGQFDGIGYAIITGDGVACIDIDYNCPEDTKAEIVKRFPSYTEKSLSGKGLHIWLNRDCKTFKDNGLGVEVFGSSQFVAMTGDIQTEITDAIPANDEAFVWLENLIKPKAAAKDKTKIQPAQKPRPISNATDELSKIENALSYISPDCSHDDWYKIGAAIYNALGASGFSVWDRWSSQSSLYKQNEMQSKYNSFAGLSDITAATLFKHAINGGWKPPRQNDFENANAAIVELIEQQDDTPPFNAWGIKWTKSDLTTKQIIAELESETEEQRILELSLELANKMSLSYPHVYSVKSIYKTIANAAKDKLHPAIIDAIINRAYYSVVNRHRIALELIKVKDWGKHTVKQVLTLEGLSMAYSGLIIVNAPTGYSKTQIIGKNFIEHAKRNDKLSIAIAHRVSLIADLCDRLGLTNYEDIKKNKALAMVIESLGICVHSLAQATFRPFLNKVSHVFVDEISQVIRVFGDSAMAGAEAVYKALRELIAEAECVIVADANIDQMTLNFLETCRPNEIFTVIEVLPVDEGKEVVFCTDENDLLDEIARRLAEGQKVWIATDSKRWAESIIASGILAHAENILLIDSETKQTNQQVKDFLNSPDEESKKYDLIFASPAISSGVSINHDQFDFVAGYFSGQSISPTDAYQMLGRVRKCRDFMICIPTKPYSYYGEMGVISGISEIYQHEGRHFAVDDYARLFQSIKTEKTNAQLAFAESLLWILESKKFKLERFTTQGTHAGSEYVLKVIRSQLNEERKQQLIDAPCITEEQAEKIERLKLKTSEQLNALEALKIKISLGYAHSYKLTEADLLLNPADLKRFNAFRGLTTVYDDSNENAVSRKFNDQRAKAYKEILGNLKPNSTFGKDEITAVMTYVVQERFRFAMLGIVNNKFGRIYRDKKGNVKPYTFKSLKQMTQDFLELLRRIGISTKDARTKASKNTNANRLQCGDEVKKCLTSGICYIANSVSETKTDRENLYQISAASWEAIEHHADRLVIKKGLKPLPIVLETRREIAAHVANDDFIWIEPIPIQNIP